MRLNELQAGYIAICTKINLFNCWEPLLNRIISSEYKRSTTIESILEKKYFKEEASRVHINMWKWEVANIW